jgi:hypothetical protein
MNRVHLLLIASVATGLAAAAIGCSRAMPTEIDQSTGNAPLVVDLDTASPLTLSSDGVGTVVSVRGPNKGNGERGGITGSFTGTGGVVCVIMDPAAKWDPSDPQTALDGGDIDLYVGKSANYSGEPGVAIGDFHAVYTDALGVDHVLDENQCIQTDRNGLPGAHAGTASPEFCPVTTEAGIVYTILGETISVPPVGKILKVATEVRNGPCPTVTENTLSGDTAP